MTIATEMPRRKFMTILGTRPEIIRLACILPALDEVFAHTIVYTNQSFDYELSTVFFTELGLRKPDRMLSVKADSLGGQIGNILAQSESVLREVKPDGVLVLGDTNSSLSAIIAKRLGIPIFHMEAGNRCFDFRVPEETNRALVDAISDYNLPYTEHGRQYLISAGIAPHTIFVTGSPLPEVYRTHEARFSTSTALQTLGLTSGQYFVVSIHREENVDIPEHLDSLVTALNTVAGTYGKPLIVTLHPRTKNRLGTRTLHDLVRLHKPFGMVDYIALQKSAFCVLSDSGSIQEESSVLGFPAVQLRRNLERPEAFEVGAMVLGGIRSETILPAIALVTGDRPGSSRVPVPDLYRRTDVAAAVTKLIHSLLITRS